jgi:hypothetical protein
VTAPLGRSDVEVWSCPDCSTTYRCPAGWEAAVFLAARRAAQVIHASRHGRSALIRNRRRATDPRPAGELPPEWADPEWAEPAPERDPTDPRPVQ